MTWCALASVLIPLLASLLIGLFPRAQAKALSQIASLLAFAAGSALLILYATHRVALTLPLLTLAGTTYFGLTIDALSVLTNFLVVFLGWLVCTYSLGYMTPANKEHPVAHGLRRYYACLLLFIGSMAGLVFSSTLVGLLSFFEITGFCSWALIGFYRDEASRRSALRAIAITHAAALGLYLATAYVYAETGSFSISALNALNDAGKTIALTGILIACWGKSAQLPFQSWLPGAMVAPTPISAYLHAASMVKVGVYILARTVLATRGVPHLVGAIAAIMAILTMIYSFLMYFPQSDMKRFLAYSTITQLSYIFLALAMSTYGSQLAFQAAVVYLFNHAFAKALFFLVAGGLSYSTGSRQLRDFAGILRSLPLAGVGYLAAALAITGVPPFSGFFSKILVTTAGFSIGKQYPIFLVLIILALLESVASFIWFIKWAGSNTLGTPSEALRRASSLPAAMNLTLVCLVAMTLISPYIAFALLT